MYLLAKSGGHKSDGNGDINSYISSYMNNLEKALLTGSVCLPHGEIFKMRNTDLQFRIPGHGWQKNTK